MKENRNTIIFVLIGVVLALLTAYFFFNQDERYDWYPTYNNKTDQPYDISLFKKTLQASYGADYFKIVRNLNSDSIFAKAENALFVYVTPNPGFDSSEIAALNAFTEKGNRVFISSNNPGRLLRNLFHDCLPNDSAVRKYSDYQRAKTIDLSLVKFNTDTALSLRYMVRDEKIRFPWPYFDLQDCELEKATVLGTFEAIDKKYTNFIHIDHGDGGYYLHATPLLFTNYHFKRKQGFEHSQRLLSLIPHVRIFYYEPEYLRSSDSQEPPISESPLRFILSNPPLKWAWYLIIGLTLIFVFNSVRRRQKAIPVFSLPANETANYLDVVSRMYQKEGRHKHILGIQEKLIKRHLQNKYRLNLRVKDPESIEEAATRLKMPASYIRQLFTEIDRAKNNSTLTDEEFKNLIVKIKEFYRKCP